MTELKSYSNVQFAEVVGDKVGNVVVFKEKLRDYGQIGRFKQLTDEHIELFKQAKNLQVGEMTWVEAFDSVIKSSATQRGEVTPLLLAKKTNINDDSDLTETLNRLADTLDIMNRILVKIEQKL